MIPSVKLAHLLRLIWGSPIFGDSFPTNALRPARVLSQIEAIYPACASTLESILVQGMPLVSPAEVGRLVQQITPKIIAFCAAIAAGEITDTERLRAAAVNIALVYWADQSMDAGDEGMERAVHRLNNGAGENSSITPEALPSLVEARLTALRWIERELENLSQPDDAPRLKHCGLQETLQNEARMRELTRCYGLEGGTAFWSTHAQEIVELSIITIVMIYVTAVMYAIYRQHQPTLPALSEVFEETTLMNVLHGPFNATLRVFDDLGDRLVDKNRFPGWGEFNLNLFNQPDAGLIHTFLRQAGLTDEATRQAVFQAFQAGTEGSRAYILQVFVELVRDRFTALPVPLWERYNTFLTLAKRTLEAGYVYLLADMDLTRASM